MKKPSNKSRLIFYGWVILCVAVVMQILTAPGQTVGVSEFKGIYAERLELTDRSIALYYCIGTALGSFALPLFGYLIDRIGCRMTLMIVASLFGVTCFLSGRVANSIELLLAFTFLRMLGQGALSLVASTLVSLWFKRRLALAYSFMSIGSGLGMMFVPYIFKPLFLNLEFVFAFQLISLAIFALIPLGYFLIVDRPQDIGVGQDGDPIAEDALDELKSENSLGPERNEDDFTFQEALMTRSFWIVTVAQSAWALIGTGLVFNRKEIFETLNASEFLTDLAVPGLFGAVIVGQLVTGLLARRFSHAQLMTAGSLGMAGACAFILFQTPLSAFRGFILFGFAQGIFVIMGQSIWADFYGRSHIGKIKGLVWMLVVMASSLGGFALTLGEDPATKMRPIFWALVAMVAISCACLFIAKPVREKA